MLAVHHGKFEQLERKIARDKLEIDLYRPMVDCVVDSGGRVQWQALPVFYDYLFVSTVLNNGCTQLSFAQLLYYISQLPLTPVTFGDRIASITDETLAPVRASVERMNAVNKCRANAGDFAATYAGRTVQITTGAFGGTFGEVIGEAGAGMIAIQIALFDQPTKCRVRVGDVKLV